MSTERRRVYLFTDEQIQINYYHIHVDADPCRARRPASPSGSAPQPAAITQSPPAVPRPRWSAPGHPLRLGQPGTADPGPQHDCPSQYAQECNGLDRRTDGVGLAVATGHTERVRGHRPGSKTI